MTLIDTFKIKAAVPATLVASLVFATFSGVALGDQDTDHCIPPNDPVAGQAYTLQQAKEISASRGGRVVLLANMDNYRAALVTAEGLSVDDGVRAVAMVAAEG